MIRVIDNHRTELSPIPSGWVHTRMKAAVKKYQNKKNEDENPTVLSLTKTGVKIKTDLSFGKSTESYIGHQIVEKGQFVFTPRDFDATPILCGVSKYNGCISNLYIVFDISKQICPQYLEYYFYGLKYGFDYFEKLSFGMRYSFNQKQFERIPLIYPNLKEQQEIADFLDRETARIDQLIDKKIELKALLNLRELNAVKEYVQELQDNPDVKLWKLSHICRIQRGKFGHRPRNAPELYDGDAPFLQTGDVARAEKFITSHKQTLSELGKSVSAKFPAKTLLMAIAANVGDLAITTYEAYCPDSVVGFIPNSSLNSEFLYYILRCLNDDISSSSTSNAQDNTNVSRLGALKIPLPSLEEQIVAVERFKAIEQSTYDISAKIQKSVDSLIESKNSLITEAVTGQLDIQKLQQRGMTDSRLDKIEEDMEQSKRASA